MSSAQALPPPPGPHTGRPYRGLEPAGPSRSLLWALGLSLGLHAFLLSWRSADPESFNRVFQDTPLEVILVNARSERRSSDVRALAQTHLDGGGDTLEIRIASQPLPAGATDNPGDVLLERQRQLQALQSQQMRLLSQLREELDRLTQADGDGARHALEKAQREERRQLLSTHLAQIEQRVQQSQSGPRKRYISPATRETVYALYYDRLRRLIEHRGTLDFPQFNGEKLYGKLTMVITVDQQGQILSAEVTSSSGLRQLDEQARAIVYAAGPFEAFDARMRQQADQIVMVSRFMFSRDDNLSTRVLAPQTDRP
jgi:periplasmic protein TonB